MIRVLLLAILILGPAAQAQVGVPRLPLGGLPLGGRPGLPAGLGLPSALQEPLIAPHDEIARLEGARKAAVALLLRRHADVLEADPSGDPIVRGEVVALSPTAAGLARALGAGFSLVHESSLGVLGIRVVVLAAPRGTTTAGALRLLRRLDPADAYDFNNIYLESGAASGPSSAPSSTTGVAANAPMSALGLIDGGVATAHPVFTGIAIHQHGCGGALIPSAHGTEVASLMVGRSARFGGAAPGTPLYAADVYCGKPTGGAADAIAEAVEWLADERVPVINVSLVGPPNVLLQQVVAHAVAQGLLIVAAVGNDGPAAPPLYPAAYPGVVGVTAVDARRRVLFDAERGPQVMFAAPGADIPAANSSDGFETVRGTSFASPLVAGLLAEKLQATAPAREPAALPAIDPAAARTAIDALARAAIHLGAAGRNAVFGYGLVGATLPSPRPASQE